MYNNEIFKIQHPKKTVDKVKKIVFQKGLEKYILQENTIYKNGVFTSVVEMDFSKFGLGKLQQMGKGITYWQSLSGAWMEIIERYIWGLYYLWSDKKENDILSFYEEDNYLVYNLSDGLASGSSYYEAYIHGNFEIIERYSQKLLIENKLNKIFVRKINLNSLSKLSYLKNFFVEISKNGLINKFFVLEIRLKKTDFYTYIAGILNDSGSLVFGSGCHFIKKVSLIRAITELFQIYNFNTYEKEKCNRTYGMGLGKFSCYFSNYVKDIITYDYETIDFEENNLGNIKSIKEVVKEIKLNLDKVSLKVNKVLSLNDRTGLFDNFSVIKPVIKGVGKIWINKYRNTLFYNKELEIDIQANIGGLEDLFFKTFPPVLLKKLDKLYLDVLSLVPDKLFKRFVERKLSIVLPSVNKDIVKYCIESNKDLINVFENDPDSFFYWKRLLKKDNKTKEDYYKLFEIYCRIGFINYGIFFLREYGLEIPNNILSRYYDKLKYVDSDQLSIRKMIFNSYKK